MKSKPIQTLVATILVLAASAQAQVTQQWVARHHEGIVPGESRAIAVDGLGNVYVAGFPDDFGSLTVAYDATGNERWTARSDSGSVDGMSMATDISGNIYLTAAHHTVSYDPSGNQRWAASFPDGAAKALVLDGAGNIYVTGNCCYTFSYDSNGNERWRIQDLDRQGTAITLDSAGSVYVTGSGSVAGSSSTVAYDASGNPLWRAQETGITTRAIAVDGLGNVYVTGQMQTDSGVKFVTIAYDPSGNQLWRDATFDGDGRAIATDNLGDIFVSGTYRSYGAAYMTIAYDSSGDQQWLRLYDGPTHNSASIAYAMVVDSSGNVYVTGNSDNSARTGWDCVTVAYDNSGNQLWVARYSGIPDGMDWGLAIVVDGSANVYVTGSSWNGTDFDFATIKYSQP